MCIYIVASETNKSDRKRNTFTISTRQAGYGDSRNAMITWGHTVLVSLRWYIEGNPFEGLQLSRFGLHKPLGCIIGVYHD
jgi:hypothetical protein